MPNLIDKTDIARVIPNFTVNIPDSDVDPHCLHVQTIDFKVNMPAAFYTAVTGTRTTNLDILFKDYIIPVLAYSTFLRFLLWHGKNITRFGIQRITESTSHEITAKELGELINDIENAASVSWTNLYNQLETDSYTYDSVAYDFTQFKQGYTSATRSWAIRSPK